jgi:alpha-mannosidase
LDEAAGGTVVSIRTPDGRTPHLTGISNDLVSYRDSGGLWRMGLEFWGGIWKESRQTSDRSAKLEVFERDTGLEITSSVELNGETFRRLMWISNDSPVITFRVEGRAAEGHSVTVRFTTGLLSSKLTMDTPGGVVCRPPKRIYDPTFWPFQHFVHFQDDGSGRGLAVLQPMPGAASYQPDGRLELVAMRNATRERLFGLIGIPGNPASGHERRSYAFEYALLFTQRGDWRENNIHLRARAIANNPWSSSRDTALRGLADSIVTTDAADVWVTAIKPASRGEGIIVRLVAPVLPDSDVTVTAHHFPVRGAFLCDARERDIGPLPVKDGAVRVAMPGTVATIRLLHG